MVSIEIRCRSVGFIKQLVCRTAEARSRYVNIYRGSKGGGGGGGGGYRWTCRQNDRQRVQAKRRR